MNVALILIISVISLIWAANHLITGALGLATRFQLSPFIMGLTVVALGTSVPELIIFILSFLKNKNHLIIGNAIGSNIANIGLILGISILIKPTTPNYNTLKKTYPIIIITMLFLYSLILDGYVGKIDGCLFLIACIALIVFFIYLSNHTHPKDQFFKEFKSAFHSNRSLKMHSLSMFLGLLVLPLSTKYLVHSTTELAKWAGMNELTIGLTIIALGATLPGLVTAITAILKGEEDIAVGTILGANIYSLLLILAFPTIITPAKISTTVLWRDLPVMISLMVLLIFLNYQYKKKLSPWHGGILLIIYCSYVISLIIKAHT
ncbi:calcium/sodium antiporter [Legionella maioricensis]|uniref:Calcium/sodium antiporter n=1 Tax=Legionella maioricensis TaxID=2896528 RepID=A0A9X2ICM9_9GAMM|nr:calcium/sodium antiporter [Legionella maioricensis]MCL9685595.1 calcium/sodium antiporter [Legionella maioricensis]MCL9689004.1 calcium/sodium antiporter [Legionella maioricensis]